MSVGIIHYKVDPHIPMFIGVIASAVVSLLIGFKWNELEEMMISGISKAMQAILILAIVGMMIGVWLVSGTIPTMIYYGLKLLSQHVVADAGVSKLNATATLAGVALAGAIQNHRALAPRRLVVRIFFATPMLMLSRGGITIATMRRCGSQPRSRRGATRGGSARRVILFEQG